MISLEKIAAGDAVTVRFSYGLLDDMTGPAQRNDAEGWLAVCDVVIARLDQDGWQLAPGLILLDHQSPLPL